MKHFLRETLIVLLLFLSAHSFAQKKKPDLKKLKFCTEVYVITDTSAIIPSQKWSGGETVKVKFLGGNQLLQSKVKQYANEWTKYANIKFEFVTSGTADIRVAFMTGRGSWSIIGNPSKRYSINEQGNAYLSSDGVSMNFGWFDNNTLENEFSRTILHEFGHALGLIHEHQHPEAGIPWNKEKVYSYYWNTNKWSREDVDNNIFAKYSTDIVQYSYYDTLSIMHYAIPAELLTDARYKVGWNRTLSEGDRQFISSTYPYSR